MRKIIVLLLALSLIVIAAPTFAQGEGVRVFEPLDRGLNYRFSYPVLTHSVRTSNLQQPISARPLVFGGQIAVEPNDSYLYAPDAPLNRATQMRLLALPMAEPPPDLAALAGALPLATYAVGDLEVQQITLGGQPAVRIDDPDRASTEIITYYDGIVYEIVIDTIQINLDFRLPEGTTYDPIYDDILASWEFTQLMQG